MYYYTRYCTCLYGKEAGTHSADFNSAWVVIELPTGADEAGSLAGTLLQHISSTEVGRAKQVASDALSHAGVVQALLVDLLQHSTGVSHALRKQRKGAGGGVKGGSRQCTAQREGGESMGH